MSLIDTRWLQQTEEDVPQENHWLGPAETEKLASFRIAKRRADWRLGRWTAKRAVASYLCISNDAASLSLIEIRPASSGAPQVVISSRPSDLAISISHSHGAAICFLAGSGVELGCDLEMVEPHSDAFVRDYFTAEEQAYVRTRDERERMIAVALIWSAKECALKALQTGLRQDTRDISIRVCGQLSAAACWAPFRACTRDGRIFQGWWQRSDKLLRTVASAPSACPPKELA
jgi:4'-phosphopantetheinyl transferase